MRSALLGLAAPIAAVAALTFSSPAAAEGQNLSTAGFSAHGAFHPFTRAAEQADGSHVRIHRGVVVSEMDGTRHDRDHRRRRNRDDVFFGGWVDGDWAYYNNRSWEPDSFNDWWHDRPDRAYPAWMRRNQHCERMWYSGDTLVC